MRFGFYILLHNTAKKAFMNNVQSKTVIYEAGLVFAVIVHLITMFSVTAVNL